MNQVDLIVLFGTLLFIVVYGVYKTRGQKNIQSYLLGDNSLKWSTIGLSVMATQASAITFISTPGQAYESGMGFVQNYFGLPIALLIVTSVFIPIYYKLKVYTAYEYLEKRFDLKTRLLGATLFLIQRGLAAGITIYAPAIILSSILGWNLNYTIIVTGLLVIIYTMSGGTKAVAITQKQQMAVIMLGMFFAFGTIIYLITKYISFGDAVNVASILGKTKAVDFDFNFEKRYTFWSGITGGLFLALSYFGTDQSQVQRYLGGKDVKASKMGLYFNAIFKIPMQLFILFTGVMVFIFYTLYQSPVHFKQSSIDLLENSSEADTYHTLENEYERLTDLRKDKILEYSTATGENRNELASEIKDLDIASQGIRKDVKDLIVAVDESIETKDADYVFLTFILNYLPHGFIGLLIAVILSAAMSSTSSELNALASTASVDYYKRLFNTKGTDSQYLNASKLLTFLWGVLAILFALMAKNSENLIEAVNIIGSLFYGTILGIFLVAFFLKNVKGSPVFYAAIIAEISVIVCHFLTQYDLLTIGYLWYNAIGCGLTIFLSWIFNLLSRGK